ncbi:hypothetical protein [Ekhidna sp.]|uniref:hypothetical protein n=1 Tax=Ekhidna sp. TaxID=2608089 RepID=UPI003B59D9BA
MICYFGHHRSGSSYIRSVLEAICVYTGKSIITYHTLDNKHIDPGFDFVISSNAKMEHLDLLDVQTGFHVIRDPRDVVVSSYFSHLHSHPTSEWTDLIEHRKILQGLSKKDGLKLEISSCRADHFQSLYTWDYTNPVILELRFEDLINSPANTWDRIIDHCFDLSTVKEEERKMIDKLIVWYNRFIWAVAKRTSSEFQHFFIKKSLNQFESEKAIRSRSFKRVTKRNPGEENVYQHYRKGEVGDWKNHFDEQTKTFFKEYWGGLLIKLGYEQNMDW